MNKQNYLIFALVLVSLFSMFAVLAQVSPSGDVRVVNSFLAYSNYPSTNTLTVTYGDNFDLSLVAYSYNGPLDEEKLTIGNKVIMQQFENGYYTQESGTIYYRYTNSLNIDTARLKILPGTYTISFYSDSGANSDTSNLTLIVKPVTVPDTTAPIVKILNPINGGIYYNNVTLSTFNVTENSLDSCWYEFNGVSHSLSSCTNLTENQINNLATVYGINNLTVYANDTSGNVGNDSISFELKKQSNPDTTAPVVSIYYPFNTHYQNNVSYSEFGVVEDNLDSCWYELNGVSYSLNSCTNSSVNIIQNLATVYGINNLTVYANDTSGNVGSDNVVYYLDKIVVPYVPLNMSVLVPINNYTYNGNLIFNVTTNKNATVVYSLDSGSNVTMNSSEGIYHFSRNLTLSVGEHNVTFCGTSQDNSSDVVCSFREFTIKDSTNNGDNNHEDNSCANGCCDNNVLDLRDNSLDQFYKNQQAADDAKRRNTINLNPTDETVTKTLNWFQKLVNWFSGLFGFGNVY